MREFAKHASLAIRYMEKYHPDLGVGIGEDKPTIKYLRYDEEWDKSAPIEDLTEFGEYAEQKIDEINKSLRDAIKN